MSESDCEYFERRAAQERTAAQQANHAAARESHLGLARRYEEMALATKPAEWLIRPGTQADARAAEIGDDTARAAPSP